MKSLLAFLSGLVVILGGGPQTTVVTGEFIRTQGVQTNVAELANFSALSDGEPYATRLADLIVIADDALTFNYTLTAGDWEADAGDCEPVGLASTDDTIRLAAVDIYALALAGTIMSNDTYKAAAKTHIEEFEAMTDFEYGTWSGANECSLHIGSALALIVEAAWLLEESGYDFDAADRLALAEWIRDEAWPVVSYPITERKNNWSVVTLASALAASAYVEGAIPLLTWFDTTTISPTDFIANADEYLAAWKATDDPFDSNAGDCSQIPAVYGLQSHGGYPDELRRSSEDTDASNCAETSITFDCTTSTSCGNGHLYQHKATQAVIHISEILRRLDGNGTRGYDVNTHGGAGTDVYDMLNFATGGDGLFQTYYCNDFSIASRYMLGEYLGDDAIVNCLDDGSVQVDDGADLPFASITHAPGVVYGYSFSMGDLTDHIARIPDISNPAVITWADAHDTIAELQALGWAEITIQASDCADNGATSGADNGVIASAITANCGGDSDCDEGGGGTIFYLDNESTCVFDVTSTVSFSCSNCALVETAGTTATISCNNDTVPTNGDDDMNRNECFTFGNPSTATASSQTWTGGSAQGTTAIEVSSATAFSAGDLAQLSGNTSTGSYSMPWVSRVASVTADGAGGVQDVITLEDGLPVAYNLASGTPTIARRTGYRSNIILLNFDIGWIDMPNGTSSTDTGSIGNAGGTIDLAETDYLLIQGMTIGPQILHAVRPSNGQFHANNVIRGNEFLKHITSLRRGSRSTSLNWSGGSRLYAYDNYWNAGSPRMINFEGSYSWNYFGFNWQVAQEPIEGDTGTGYCWGDSTVTPAPGSFANNTSVGGGPGDRSIFFHGDSGGEDGSGHIIERTRADCVVQLQNAINYDGFSTFYGNRAEDPKGIGGSYTGGFESAAFGSGNSNYFNLFANLFRKYQRIDQMPNLLGRWNLSRVTGDSSPSGSGADWGATNEVSASAANTNIDALALPPSIVFRQDDPPDWWCQEACPWEANMPFGSAETTSNGCKLPAQIRAEGGTCTPP